MLKKKIPAIELSSTAMPRTGCIQYRPAYKGLLFWSNPPILIVTPLFLNKTLSIDR